MERAQTSDLELLHRWRAGCRKAGDALIDRHSAAVYRFFRTKVTAELDDLVQQTFLACVEARGQFRQESSFKTYLLAIARYQLYARYGRRRLESLDAGFSWVHDTDGTPMSILFSRERRKLLASALQQLSQEAQAVLARTYLEGLSGPEIARALDIPVNTVYSRLHRARRSLRELLRDDGVSLRPGSGQSVRSAPATGRRDHEDETASTRC